MIDPQDAQKANFPVTPTPALDQRPGSGRKSPARNVSGLRPRCRGRYFAVNFSARSNRPDQENVTVLNSEGLVELTPSPLDNTPANSL